MRVVVSKETHQRFEGESRDATVASTEAQPLILTNASVLLVRIDRGQEQLPLRLDPKLLAEQQRIRRANEELERK